MPIRTASLSKKIAANGQALHRAVMRRAASGADAAPSDTEAALLEERRQLKEERDKRSQEGRKQRPSALDRLVRTHHPQAKDKPKAKGGAHDAHDAKKPKARKTRSEKHAEKAAALEAARRAPRKPATK